MKALIICNTYLMLLSALQLKRYELKREKVDIILTDYTTNMESVAKKLEEINLFNHVYFCRIKNIYQGGNLLHKVRKTFLLFENRNKARIKFRIHDWNYDIFAFSNFDIPATQLYVHLKRANPQIAVWRYEEGYSTYLMNNGYWILEKIFRMAHRFLKVPEFVKAVEKIYLYEPEYLLYEVPYQKKRLEKMSKGKEDKDLLNFIFSYSGEAEEFEKYKYIIFEESFCVDHKEKINDFELFHLIADKAGKENVIIKLHPRNESNRFQELKVGNNKVPWEIIQLNGNFKDKTFITITSGSVLASKLWLKDSVKTVFLYKCTKKKPLMVKKKYGEYLSKIKESDGNNDWLIPDDEDVLLQIL